MIKRKVTESTREKSYLLAILIAGTAILSGCSNAANNSYSDTLNSIMEAASENANTDTYKDKTISAIIYGSKTSI